MDYDAADKRITLVIKNVDPAIRHGFNETCEAKRVDRGELISQLMEDWVRKVWGPNSDSPDEYIEGYRNWLRQEGAKEKAKLSPTNDEGPSGMD